MRARVGLFLVALAAAVVLSGCGGAPTTDGSATTTDTDEVTPAGGLAPEGFEAMPTDGAGESAAAAQVPAVFAAEKASGKWPGVDFEALDGVVPSFVAYIVRVDLGGQVGLFEVRADGIAHNLYAYQRAFDAGSIIWTPVEMSQTSKAEARSGGEKAAVAAVEAAMKDSFPDESFATTIHGYRFVYLLGDAPELTIEIAPDGTMISVGM